MDFVNLKWGAVTVQTLWQWMIDLWRDTERPWETVAWFALALLALAQFPAVRA